MQTIVKKMPILSAAHYQEEMFNSFSRQTLRHGRCDGRERNPDQVNPELSKVHVTPDLPI